MPAVVDGPVLLARAARLLDVGNEGLSTVSQKLFISFFLNDLLVVELEEIQSKEATFYLVSYFILGDDFLTS